MQRIQTSQGLYNPQIKTLLNKSENIFPQAYRNQGSRELNMPPALQQAAKHRTRN